ncbi:MAG: hypothetical protein PUG71_07270 [bacterium]|nr:hypothetical protein [bacterium]
MAKLSMFMLCNAINNLQQANGSIPQLIGPQTVLRPQFVPSNFSFGIAVGVTDVNLHESYRIRFTIADPDGKVVHDSGESDFPAIEKADTLPVEYQGFALSIDIRNLIVEKEGAFKFNLFINGKVVGEHEIPIFCGGKQ